MNTLGGNWARVPAGGSTQTAQWLVAANHADAVALHRMIGTDQSATLVYSGDSARRALLMRACWRGLVIDMALAGDAALDVLALARRLHPHVPAAVLATRFDPVTINRVFVLGAGVLCKPVEADAFAAFTSRCVATERLGRTPAVLVGELARQYGLSPREVELLVDVVSGRCRAEILRRMDISENTLKTHTRSLLRKMDASHLSELTIDILRTALNG